MDSTSSTAPGPKDELPLATDKPLPKSSSKLPSLRASRKFARSLLTGSVMSSVSSSKKDSFPEQTREMKAKAETPPPLDILSHCVALSDNIFGLYALEAWHFDEVSGKLININLQPHDEEQGQSGGGLVVKRITQEADPDNDYSSSDAIDAFQKLTDRSRNDYLEAKPTAAGVGLAGALWAESSSHHHTLRGMRGDNLSSSHYSVRGRKISPSHHSVRGRKTNSSPAWDVDLKGGESIKYRDVDFLANDPDQPYSERLQAFAKAGFTLATGIPFDSNGYRGIVIFFVNPHADPSKVQDPTNSNFIKHAAQMIGAAAAIKVPLKQIKDLNVQIRNENWHRLKIKLLTIVRFGGSLRRNKSIEGTSARGKKCENAKLSSFASLRETSYRLKEDFKSTLAEAKGVTKTKLSRWYNKVQGGTAGVPPSFTYTQCAWSFLGVMITHLILSRIYLLVNTQSNGEFSLVLAPLGALTTLQYNLTAAPASQPRNAIFAQVFAVSVALVLCYIPGMSPWIRTALAPSIVIPGMAKLGITHPPAGAAAIVFASGQLGWEEMGIFMSGVSITIITAVIINNMCDHRQYPTSWPLLNKAKDSFISSD